MREKTNTFIFIVGCEGCGHHGLEPVIETAINNSGANLYFKWGPLRNIFNELWYAKKQVTENARQILSKIENTYIFESNSFPAFNFRTVDAQWDLEEMTNLLRPYAKIRYLVLHRDPIAMAFSHKDFDGGLRNHAKVIATFLKYLNLKLSKIDSNLFTVINYEDLLEKQDALASPLAHFLGLSEQDIKTGFKHIRKSTKDWRVQMNLEDRGWMKEFFKEHQYPIFNDSSFNILGKTGK